MAGDYTQQYWSNRMKNAMMEESMIADFETKMEIEKPRISDELKRDMSDAIEWAFERWRECISRADAELRSVDAAQNKRAWRAWRMNKRKRQDAAGDQHTFWGPVSESTKAAMRAFDKANLEKVKQDYERWLRQETVHLSNWEADSRDMKS